MIEWSTAALRADKSDMQAGIVQWIREQTGIPNARLSYLHQLTIDDTMLLAMAIGYKPPEKQERWLRERFANEAQREATRAAKWQAAEAVRNGTAIPLPDHT